MKSRLIKLLKECDKARSTATFPEKNRLARVMQECVNKLKQIKLNEDAGLTWDGVSGSTCMYLNEDGATAEQIAGAISHRIQTQHLDLLRKFDIRDLLDAINDVASFFEGAEEIGSSDVSAMVNQVISQLERSVAQKVTEDSPMVKRLRDSFAGINTINPDSPTYEKLLALLDRLPDEQLQELANAGIKFVSGLARNRVGRRGIKEHGGGGKARTPWQKFMEAPGAETLAHNQSTVASNEKAMGLAERGGIPGVKHWQSAMEDGEGESTDIHRTYVKKGGKRVGEIGIDLEASPGNGQWYVKHYASGTDLCGYDSKQDALGELKYIISMSPDDMKEGLGDAIKGFRRAIKGKPSADAVRRSHFSKALAAKATGKNAEKEFDNYMKVAKITNPKQAGVKEEVDTGEYDARKSQPSSKEEQDKVFAKHRERMKNLDKEDVEEAQSMGTALRNTLSKVEPGSKLDKKIRHHNDLVRRFGADSGTMTSAPDGYHIDKKGFVRLGEGLAEGSDQPKYTVANYRGTPCVFSPSNRIRRFESSIEAHDWAKKKNAELASQKQGVAEGNGSVMKQNKYYYSGDKNSPGSRNYSNNDGDSYDLSVGGGWSHSKTGAKGKGSESLRQHIQNKGVAEAVVSKSKPYDKYDDVPPDRVDRKKEPNSASERYYKKKEQEKKGVAEGEYDDPRWEPRKPERNVDWDIEQQKQRELDEPKSAPKTVTITDEDGEVVLTFPSTGGYYGDVRHAKSKGFDTEAGDYSIEWKRDSVTESVSPDYVKER